MTKKPGYHHGDLRNALLRAAMDILETEGLESLSLRQVAARVGVSHAAPAHHFPTLRALLNGLATIGFDQFTAAMREERARSAADPVSQMRGAGRGYLAFAEAHPALFRLMFTATMIDWTDTALTLAGEASYAQLVEICAPAADRLGLTEPAARTALERLVWSQVHGRAHLTIDAKFPAGRDRVPDPIDLPGLLFAERAPAGAA